MKTRRLIISVLTVSLISSVFLTVSTVEAIVIEREVVFTLNSNQLRIEPDNNGVIGVSFNPKVQQFCCPPIFQAAMPQTGDTIIFHIRFQDALGNKQFLQIGDLGLGNLLADTIHLSLANVSSDLSVDSVFSYSILFIDTLGEVLINPVNGGVRSGGGGIGTGSVRTNLTDSSFSFSGIDWTLNFSNITYNTGGNHSAHSATISHIRPHPFS